MISFFKLFFRNLRRGGVYSAINVGGLAVGMAATMLIVLWVYNQWSYDRFHEKGKLLYQVRNYSETNGYREVSPKILGPTLLEEFPEIADMTRCEAPPIKIVCASDEKILDLQVKLVDPGFFRMYSFPLLQGDASTALNQPSSVVLTRDVARRFFGNDDPMGKTVTIRGSYPVTVTGVIDLPQNTVFDFEALFSYSLMKELGAYDEAWSNYTTATYVELQPGIDEAEANAAIKGLIAKHTDNKDVTELFLFPLAKCYLYSQFEDGKAVGGRIDTLRIFAFIAFAILLIACINFMNMSTARSSRYAKETGVRKVIGARRGVLVFRFLGESILTAAISAAAATMIVLLCLPAFNNLTGKQLELGFDNSGFWIAITSFVLLTGLLAGSYPAFYLSSFLPVKVLKGVFKGGRDFVSVRKVLIVTQFTFAVMLTASAAIVYRQIHYAQDRDAGYDKSRLIYLELSDAVKSNHGLVRNELLDSGIAESVTFTFGTMTGSWSKSWDAQWRGKDPSKQVFIERFYVDADWAKTTGVEILQGRDIDMYTYPGDVSAMLLNESAVKMMGFTDPVGEVIRETNKEWHVVGVIKDFVLDSPYDPVRPMTIGGPAGWFNHIHIKLSAAGGLANNLARAEKIFKKYNPELPFIYHFVDEIYARKFDSERRVGTMITWFGVLAGLISCLGLFGLSAYMAESRRKEIGIRKVLGASVKGIFLMLSKEFTVLVFVSVVIAVPVVWWVGSQWLNAYAYRTDIPWWLFAAVGVIGLSIALLTVGWQALRAAMADPVKSIKTE